MARWNSTFDGRVVADPEVKTFDNGGSNVSLPIYVNHRRKDQSGEWADAGTSRITYIASGEYGEALKQFKKGNIVQVTDAATQAREFERKDGTKGLAIEARFGTIELINEGGAAQEAPAKDPW